MDLSKWISFALCSLSFEYIYKCSLVFCAGVAFHQFCTLNCVSNCLDMDTGMMCRVSREFYLNTEEFVDAVAHNLERKLQEPSVV